MREPRVLRPENRLVEPHRSLQQTHGFGVTASSVGELGEQLPGLRRLGVLGPQGLLPNGESATEELFRLVELTLLEADHAQKGRDPRHVGMLSTPDLLAPCQGA